MNHHPTITMRIWADLYTDVEVDVDDDGHPEFDPDDLTPLVEGLPITKWEWDGLSYDTLTEDNTP